MNQFRRTFFSFLVFSQSECQINEASEGNGEDIGSHFFRGSFVLLPHGRLMHQAYLEMALLYLGRIDFKTWEKSMDLPKSAIQEDDVSGTTSAKSRRKRKVSQHCSVIGSTVILCPQRAGGSTW